MLSHVLLSSWCPITFRKLVEEVTYAWEWRKGCWNSFLTTLSDIFYVNTPTSDACKDRFGNDESCVR